MAAFAYDYHNSTSVDTSGYVHRISPTAGSCSNMYDMVSVYYSPKFVSLDGRICPTEKAMNDWNNHLRSKACWKDIQYSNPAAIPLTRKVKKKKTMTAMSRKQNNQQRRKQWQRVARSNT